MGNCLMPSQGSFKEYKDQYERTYGANECNRYDENEAGLRIQGSINECKDQYGPTYGANKCHQDDESETGPRIQRSINEYNGKQITGISGRRGHCVDQLTFHYSDGSNRTVGANGGDAVEEQTLKKGESIVLVKWDRLGSSYLGCGFEFVLSSGRSIKVEGYKATWLRYNVSEYSSDMVFQSSENSRNYSKGKVLQKSTSFLADIIFHYDDSSVYNFPEIMVWQYVLAYGTVDPASKVSMTVYSIFYNYIYTYCHTNAWFKLLKLFLAFRKNIRVKGEIPQRIDITRMPLQSE